MKKKLFFSRTAGPSSILQYTWDCVVVVESIFLKSSRAMINHIIDIQGGWGWGPNRRSKFYIRINGRKSFIILDRESSKARISHINKQADSSFFKSLY